MSATCTFNFDAFPAAGEQQYFVHKIDHADVLSFALCSKRCRDMVFAAIPQEKKTDPYSRARPKRNMTPVSAVVTSVNAMQLARKLGCPWDARVTNAAAKGGNEEVLRAAIAANCPFDTTAVLLAALGGHGDVISMLRAHGAAYHPETTAAAAASGHLDLIKRLVADHCPLSANTVRAAVTDGHFDICVWARSQGVGWGSGSYGVRELTKSRSESREYDEYEDGRIFRSLCAGPYAEAADSGNLHVLDWLAEQGCPWPSDGDYGYDNDESDCLYAVAAYGGHKAVIEWLESRGVACQTYSQERACEAAAAGGQLDLLKLLREKGFSWCKETCKAAAACGHLEVLRWARANGAEWDEETPTEAAKNGHVACLEYIFSAEGGFSREPIWSKDPMTGEPHNDLLYMSMYACDCGQPHVLEWLKRNGLPYRTDWQEKREQRNSGPFFAGMSIEEEEAEEEYRAPRAGPEPKYIKKLTSIDELQVGRLGAIYRGDYVIVVKCGCFPHLCNCHVSIFWKDEHGTLHNDREEMFKQGFNGMIDDFLCATVQTDWMYGDDFEVSATGAHKEPSTTNLPHTIDTRIVNLAECYALRSELWSAVRIHLEVPVAGSNDWRALPSCFAHFFELSQPGTIVRLRDAGAAEAANLAIAALGGEWSGPGPLNLEW